MRSGHHHNEPLRLSAHSLCPLQRQISSNMMKVTSDSLTETTKTLFENVSAPVGIEIPIKLSAHGYYKKLQNIPREENNNRAVSQSMFNTNTHTHT